MATWGIRRPYPLRDRNQWFWMLWPHDYHAGRGYRPLAGDDLTVWDENDKVYQGTILEARSFVYSSHDEVKIALGGFREGEIEYVKSRPTTGFCVAVRSELTDVAPEPCPMEARRNSWVELP
jgi:hypothetical protein